MEVVITGMGLRSCLGNLSQTWKSLIQGQSGIQIQQPFPELPPRPLGLLSSQPTPLAKITVLAFTDALQDAGLQPPLAECGVVVGSSRACQGELEALAQQQYLSPRKFQKDLANWLSILPQQASVITAQLLQTQGIVFSPMSACATGIWSVFQGYELIRTGQCSQVVAGAVESPITPLTLAGFNQMGALAKTGCYPFDKEREGLALGEGGGILVLESLASASHRQAKIYGKISGFGLTCDASHISAPSQDKKAGIRAIKNCLEQSQLSPSEIDYIHAHGTSTKLNDAYESELIKAIFPRRVAVSSTKGATGHTLGASGAMGIIFSVLALKNQITPPCIGLRRAEFDLNLVISSQQSSLQNALCFSFGFGGQNAVIALSANSP